MIKRSYKRVFLNYEFSGFQFAVSFRPVVSRWYHFDL